MRLVSLSWSHRARVCAAREALACVPVERVLCELKARGFTILLVEQNFRFAATVADRHYVMEDGRIVDMVGAADVAQNLGKLQAYLGV